MRILPTTKDWSSLNGLLIGIAVAVVIAFILPYNYSPLPFFFGAIASGYVSRRNGWMVGTVFGLLVFCIGIYSFLQMRSQFPDVARHYPIMAISPSRMTGYLMCYPPLGTAGGFVGSLIRRFFITPKN